MKLKATIRLLLLALLALFVSCPSFAQGIHVFDTVFTNSGGFAKPLASPVITVCGPTGSGNPCTPTVTIYSNQALTITQANPITGDSNGNFDFYVAPGKYFVSIQGAGVIAATRTYTVPCGVDATNCNFGGASPAAPGNSIQKANVGVTGFAASSITDDGTKIGVGEEVGCFNGPNPYVDIRCFGARAVNPAVTPSAVGLTANCTATQTTCTISSASTFVNGDGVVIYGAGASHSMTTPGAPTVTPSLSLAGTGTLINTPGPAGATTYNYRVIARDRNGGLTAPSTTGSTTTGAATLGAITVNITSMSRSTQTVTVVTAAAHGFLVGCNGLTCGEVFIGGGNALSDASFRGWFTVTSAADTTHFTFVGPPSTALGASTSATGGTATFYNSNLVCAPGVVTGAVYYAFYSDRAVAGTYALIGVSNPSGTQTDLCIEDFGSPMMDNQAFPAIFPASFAAGSPPAATSDSLSTTITSGGGTTTLTLANAAGTTVSGATIRLDAVPAIKAAAASITTGYGTLYIPADVAGNSFVVNSWLQLSGNQLAVSQSGALFLNDTIETASCGQGCAKWIGDVLPQHPSSGSNVGWSPMPVVSINSAHPGFFIAGSPQGVHVSHLKLTGVPVNGTLGILMEAGQNQTLDWIDCAPGSGANDYMSSCFQFRLNPGNNSPGNITLDYVGMSPGGGTDGASHTPVAYCRNCGNMIIPHAYLVHRGMQYWGSSVAQLGVGGVVYINGGGSPLLTMYGNPVAGNAVIGNLVLDTIAHPCVASLVLPITIQFMNGACAPSSSVLPISGTYSVMKGSFGSTVFSTFPNVSATVSNQGVIQNYANAFNITGSASSAFINNAPMAAPTCAVSAGGTLAVATYLFSIVPVWWNGLEGQWSLPSTSCTTTTGNQTITLNWTVAPGNPQFYNIYYCTGACNPSQGGSTPGVLFHIAPTATSVVWSSTGVNQLVATGMSRGGPTMMMDGTKGMAAPNFFAPQFQLSNSGFTSTDTATLTANRTIATPDVSGTKMIVSGTPASGNVAQFSTPTGLAIDSGLPVGKIPSVLYLTSNYTNATTTFSNVTGMSFSAAANANYKVRCDLDYQTSATTADIKIQWTGPASPTAVTYDLVTEVTGSSLSASVATAFSTALSESGTPTITTNFPLTLTLTLINGANAGTVQLQAAATGVGTVTIIPGSCSVQQ